MHCIFCQIVSGQAQSVIVYQDEAITAFQDIRPQAPTHVLIVPNEHITSMKKLCEAGNSLLNRMFSVAHHLAETAGVADTGYRLVINTGPEAGQIIDHIHIHLLGGKRMKLEGMALRFRDDV